MGVFNKLRDFFVPPQPIAWMDDPFLQLDRAEAAVRLRLVERGTELGRQNLPMADADTFDAVENEVVSEIQEHLTSARIDAANQNRVYGERLSELALLRELSAISTASRLALSDFTTAVTDRKNSLANHRDSIKRSYDELGTFRATHNLRRPARDPAAPLKTWSTISVAWLMESLLNMSFLMVNDEMGAVGGLVAALGLSFINVGGATLIGYFILPWVGYKSRPVRVGAGLLGLAWFVGMFAWNMLAGHYRDAKAAGMVNPEGMAAHLFAQNGLAFDSIASWGLFLIGIAASLLSCHAAYRIKDPYPHYGDVSSRHEGRCQQYADELKDAFDQLQDIRDAAIEEALGVKNELAAQLRERGRILAGREALKKRFDEHQADLEQTTNALLQQYRMANIAARTTPAPLHFKERFALSRSALPPLPPEPTTESEVKEAQCALDRAVETISDAYDNSIASFEHLEAIKRDLRADPA